MYCTKNLVLWLKATFIQATSPGANGCSISCWLGHLSAASCGHWALQYTYTYLYTSMTGHQRLQLSMPIFRQCKISQMPLLVRRSHPWGPRVEWPYQPYTTNYCSSLVLCLMKMEPCMGCSFIEQLQLLVRLVALFVPSILQLECDSRIMTPTAIKAW